MTGKRLMLIALAAALAVLSPAISQAGPDSRASSGPQPGLGGPIVQAGYVIFRTDQSEFLPDTENQGWWSSVSAAFDDNDNYVTGSLSSFSTDDYRDFFTFDLRQFSGSAIRAELLVTHYNAIGDHRETLTLYDVTTDAAVLNANVGMNSAIFDDLGTGIEYGSYDVPRGLRAHVAMRFEPNADGVAAVNAAAGGFFSIGGRVVTAESPNEYLFGASGPAGPQWLVVQLAD